MTSLPPSGLWAGETLALGVGMKEGRKCGGRDGAGRRWQGGTESQRWLLAPAPLGQLRPEGLEQLLGLEVRCGGPSLARGRAAREREEIVSQGMGQEICSSVAPETSLAF